MMQDKRALQAGTSHFLGQNFSKAFDVANMVALMKSSGLILLGVLGTGQFSAWFELIIVVLVIGIWLVWERRSGASPARR